MQDILKIVAAVGIGILIESPEKRKKVFGMLDQVGKTAEKTIKEVIPKNVISKGVGVDAITTPTETVPVQTAEYQQ
jgi:hypothetical protein